MINPDIATWNLPQRFARMRRNTHQRFREGVISAGWSKTKVWRFENGHFASITLEDAHLVASVLGITIEDLSNPNKPL